MNKSNFQEWKSHAITKQILADIDDALEGVRNSSSLKETCDKTAMQTSYNEGFCEGVAAFLISIETLELNMEDESNED